jgi:phosphoglycerate dehydrogenase-like enzyme
MLAAVTVEAFDAVRELAPAAVELVALGPEDVPPAATAFLVPSWSQHGLPAALPDLASLRVVQLLSAGTDWIDAHVPPWATLCNARGARDVPVAEWVVGALLGATSGLLDFARRREWRYERPRELLGMRVLILGMGSIGEAVRARLEPLGAHVVGVASRPRPGVHGIGELAALLAGADALVVLAPLTDATRGLLDAALLAELPDGALVVNAGRGAVLDTDALLAELHAGRLRAVLDVVDPEPLPADHPLWSAPGVLAITPHLSGDSDAAEARAARLAGQQLARFVAGEPLKHVVREAGS